MSLFKRKEKITMDMPEEYFDELEEDDEDFDGLDEDLDELKELMDQYNLDVLSLEDEEAVNNIMKKFQDIEVDEVYDDINTRLLHMLVEQNWIIIKLLSEINKK